MVWRYRQTIQNFHILNTSTSLRSCSLGFPQVGRLGLLEAHNYRAIVPDFTNATRLLNYFHLVFNH
jgi:hypothetical protein